MSQPFSETIFYQDPTPVFVSSARIVIGAKTYAARNITSIGMAQIPPRKGPVMGFTIIGFLLVIAGLVLVFVNPAIAGILLGIGAVFTLVGLVMISLAKPRYAVRVGSVSGESDSLISPDQIYIKTVVEAIQRALIYKS